MRREEELQGIEERGDRIRWASFVTPTYVLTTLISPLKRDV